MCTSSQEQGAAPIFASGNGEDVTGRPKLGVKRKAVHQKVPKPKVAKVNTFLSYLDDHPIAAINRLRMARESVIMPFSPTAVESAQCNSQASHASTKKACGSLELAKLRSCAQSNQDQ